MHIYAYICMYICICLQCIFFVELQALLPFDEAKNHHSACVDKEESTGTQNETCNSKLLI